MLDGSKITADEFLASLGDSRLNLKIGLIIGGLRSYKQKQADADKAEELLEAKICKYNESRLKLLTDTVRGQGKEWCTQCSNIFEAAILKPIYVEEGEFEDGKHDAPYIRVRNLHRVCVDCFEFMRDRSGQYGIGDDNRAVFYAFRVENRVDGTCYNHFGNWRLLPNAAVIVTIPTKVSEKDEKEFLIPPELTYSSYLDHELKIKYSTVIEP
jgi:hypothetical protein